MLKAMNAWAAPSETSFEDMFRDLAEAGFDGVELNFEREGASAHSLTLATSDGECERIRALANACGLRITSICAAVLGHQIGTLDTAENEKGQRAICRQLQMAKLLGCRSILIYAGGFTQTQTLKQAYDRALSILREMKPIFEAQDALVSIENANQFFLSPFDFARFIDDIGCDTVGAYLDFANAQIFQYPFSDHWLDVLGKRVFNVHIKDYKPLGLGLGTFVPLLAGEVPYKRIMPMLREIGYDGPLVAELPNMMPSAPKYLYESASRALDVIRSF